MSYIRNLHKCWKHIILFNIQVIMTTLFMNIGIKVNLSMKFSNYYIHIYRWIINNYVY